MQSSAQWLQLARLISERGDTATAAFVGALALAERLLGPALVHLAIRVGAGQALAVGAVLTGVVALRSLLQTATACRTEARLYSRIVESALKQDVLQPSILPDEEARAAVFEGAHGIAGLVAGGLPHLGANIIAACGFALFVALTQPWRVVLASALAGAVGIVLLLLSRRSLEAAQRGESAAWIQLIDGVGNAFDGRLDIVAGGRSEAFVAAFGTIAASWSKAIRRAARASRLAGRLPLLALTLAVGAAVVLESRVRGEQAGQTFAHAALLASMVPAFVGVSQGLQELGRSHRRMRPLLQLLAVGPARPTQAAVPSGDRVHSVELRDVHFSYEREGRRHEALRGISFLWSRGELLAIAGPNGCGKSTCLRTILGLGRRSSGDVLVDGVPLESLDLETWRRSVSFLPQRPYLPPRVTIRQCLRFIDSDVTDEVMTDALQRSGLLSALRCEVASALEARVDELSVGQRQRVGLARLLCRRAAIVMLDEPDANLDRAGIALLTALLRDLSRDHLVLVAAHSPELLSAVDRVVTLDAGRIASRFTPPAAFA
jgi:ABC-type transport system involved in cytochrome bd biosynthesis fused ATPase/permease subunit